MIRADAEAIYDAGKEAVIVTLLQQCEQIKKLEKQVASLSKNSSNSSNPPSSDGPGKKKKRKSRKKPTATPARYQWFELPVIKMIMEEFRCHTLTCFSHS